MGILNLLVENHKTYSAIQNCLFTATPEGQKCVLLKENIISHEKSETGTLTILCVIITILK